MSKLDVLRAAFKSEYYEISQERVLSEEDCGGREIGKSVPFG